MTASWLKQMGWRDVFVLAGSGNERVRPIAPVLGPAIPSELAIEARELSGLGASHHVTVVDLSLSPAYRRRHIPGAWYATRTRLQQALTKIPQHCDLVLTPEDGILSPLAARYTR